MYLFNQSKVKIRKFKTKQKNRFCFWCGRTLNPGKEYVKQTFVNGGKFYHLYWHTVCMDAVNEYHESMPFCDCETEACFEPYYMQFGRPYYRGEGEYYYFAKPIPGIVGEAPCMSIE